jgi:hypothetical protein
MQTSRRNVAAIRQEIEQARKQSAQFPKDHVIAIAFARVFGPRNATTPEGHPIVISSGPFDLTVETPQHAIARAARRWFGIEVHEPHWEIEMAEDVIIAADHPMAGMVPWSKFFHLRFTPEATKWNERGLHDGNVPNHFGTDSSTIHDRPLSPGEPRGVFGQPAPFDTSGSKGSSRWKL